MKNAFTVDVEEYFQVSAFAPYIARSAWERLPSRVERSVDSILEMLSDRGARGTFFTLGWIAERHPALVRRIAAQGHEIASHGYSHLRATDQTREEFEDDVVRSKRLLEEVCGAEVKGYRAPSFSIGANNLWALECLAEAGYRYSSSIYPVRHDHYGMPEAPRFAWHPDGCAKFVELPVTTVAILDRNLPAGGGGYFRLMPYAVSKWCLKRVNERDAQPCIFYFHPWEVDPGQPRQPGLSLKTRFRHYVNLGSMKGRIRRLLDDFEWDRVDRVFPGAA